MRVLICVVLYLTICTSCDHQEVFRDELPNDRPYVIVLGIAQDAGFPQAGCQNACCSHAWKDKALREMVSCLGIVDPITKQCWMIDATPDFKDQLHLLKHHRGEVLKLEGIALTHAHIGHYTGLMHLGREVMGAASMPVLAMPKMKSFLSTNGPWSQLVDLQNIIISELNNNSKFVLNDNLTLRPFLVPHRDEFSETVGYEILSSEKSMIFIPDIDKWSKWDKDLISEINRHDFALLDGSFYANGEIPGRDMTEIPHPFVVETMAALTQLADSEKAKVHFIHLNHTNPILNPNSEQFHEVTEANFRVCREEQVFIL